MNDRGGRGKVSAVWRGLAALLLLIGAVAAFVGQIGSAVAQDVTETDATVRVVHASPGAPNVDVLVDGQPVVEDLAFGAATEYLAIPGGDHKVQVTPTGQGADAAVIDTDLNIDAGAAYIFVALGQLNEIEGEVYDVNLDPVDEGKARVRLIHASPDAGDISVAVTSGDELFGGVSFKDATDYKDLDAGSYSLDVKGEGDRVLLTAENIDFAAGDVYDVVALGQIADNSLALLPLVTSVSIPCAEVLGLQGGVDDACIRVVHASPGAPEVDVYLNDSPVVQGLAFGTSTEFIVVPAGDDRKLQITAAGGTPGDSDLLDADLDFDGRYAFEVVVTGNPDDLEATTARLDLSPLPEGQARVRVVHASPDAGGVDIVVADGPTLFEGVDFRGITDYTTVDAGSYSLQLKKDDTVALSGDVEFGAGMVYDVIVIGRTDDNSLALLVLSADALVREGGVATPEAQGTETAGTAETTVVDATVSPGESTVVPTAGAVDVTPSATP
ncbi:MAG: hypothetical protein QOJ59_5389 [Thermomicrobiales bacterium]|jgi:hypothetical protein|nr:hypothetical protein [Thermomicrobiales bacterium]